MTNQNKFVGNSRGFAPPPPELNFRHDAWLARLSFVMCLSCIFKSIVNYCNL